MRPLVEIIRLQSYDEDGTFGAVRINGEFVCLSLELPWKNNQRDISCIPTGQTIARRYLSPHFGYEVFRLKVLNRDFEEIHIGNTILDTKGCILLGSYIAQFGKRKGVARSRRAFLHFMNCLGTEPEILVSIKNV